jgi:flagellin
MRINTNVASLNAQRVLGQTGNAAAKSIGRLSSGFRINRAADDAAGLGIANKLRADLRGLRQAARNAEQAGSLLQVAEGAVQTISSIVDRMKELATQGASGNTSAEGRLAISAEWTELYKEIDAIVTTTKFQGTLLLDGDFSGSFLVRSSGEYADSTGDDFVTVDGTNLALDTTTLGVTDDMEAAEGDDWAAELVLLDTAVDTINTAFGAIGAAQNRIEYATANVKTTIENYAAAESTIRDADMAAEMAEFTKNQILQQAGVAMLAQANSAPQLVLRLLQ